MANSIPVFRGGQQSAYQLNRKIKALRLLSPSAALAAPVNAVAAALSTSLTGANNDMVFTAKAKGVDGNSITIAFVDPAAASAALGVVVTGTDIVVNLATSAESAITTTAAQVKTAIETSPAANALVSVANKATDTGAGAVTALAETALEGGVDGTLGIPWEQRWYSGTLYLCASDAGNSISQANWYKQQFTAA